MKSVFIKIRSTPEERKTWNEKAKSLGVPLSELIRKSFGRVQPMPLNNKKIEAERNKQIARVGNNLNQIARWANSYKTNAEATQVISHLKSIEQVLKELKPDAH
jgi:hypothetical protein